ncbi:MAG: penicillin acylase family protein [Chloroflexi bacterium]|nr:penicillin acylase family protein [Chloroflexota bacterium]MYF80828.1 penicillin acylase family protein [Chloroflexota bacterium]MYI05438.1 penicillin acylase family protein [Chloroflexota bacterium]
MTETSFGIDWRGLALSLRQGGGLLRALASSTLANALQLPQGPQRRGKTVVAGLDAPVEIIRDRYDIPHCFAESAGDALFALGYVQAQDRLWQMQWNRRAARGRLSEVAGPQALSVDRLCRTLGIGRAADAAWDATPATQRQQLAPFIAGINAAVARAPKPFEAQVLGDWIGPWQASDSIAWGKLLSLLLAPAWEQQLMRARIVEQAGLDALNELDPPLAPDTAAAMPPDAPYGQLAEPLQEAARQASDLLGLRQGASNNWAVDGRHTVDGAPLFACDPHLNPVTPPHTYFVHLHCPEFNAAGASVPGLPGIVWGFNDHIAWGPTAALMSMNVAVVEQLSEDGSKSLTPDGWMDIVDREEHIEVRGYPAERLTVRETVNGPIVSKVLSADVRERWNGDRAISLHSRILAPKHGGGGIADMLSARNWDEFSAAAGDMADFNLCYAYADRRRVGLRVSGDVPAGDMASLRLPAAGWAPNERGGVPTRPVSGDDLPHVVDPPHGVVVSANAPLAPFEQSWFGAEYLDPGRAARIRQRIAETAPHSFDSFAELQCDRVSLPLREFARRIPDDSLTEWDGVMSPESVPAAIAAATLIEYRRDALKRVLGAEGQELLAPLLAIPTLDIFAAHATSWAVKRFDADPETETDRLAAARESAIRRLGQRFGPDRSTWTWGRCRPLVLSHSLSDAPVVGSLLSLGPFDYGGEADTVAQSGVVGLQHFEAASAIPSLRLIVKLSDPPEARFAISGEQIHDPLHANGQLTDAWLKDRYLPLHRDRESVEAAARTGAARRVQRLKLIPRASVH